MLVRCARCLSAPELVRDTLYRSLREVYEQLHGYPLMGDFMSYQTTIDLNYSALIEFSENEFARAGPGALRGIKKVFQGLGDYTRLRSCCGSPSGKARSSPASGGPVFTTSKPAGHTQAALF